MKPLYVKKNGVVYKISGTGIPSIYPAANVEYDNTVTSELQATDVQGAIDELSTRQGGVQSDWNENDSTELDYIKNKPENLVQDANYVHTDNNYDATAKGKVDSLGTASAKDVGVANGVAELDSAGKVPSSQLPSFVDDVIEVADYDHLPITGESGKIYVTLDTNKTYRWTGSGYAEISESLALGETSSTAYRGDRGKTAYDHSQDSGRITAAVSSGLYKFSATAEGHISGTIAVQKSDIIALGIPAQDTNDKVTQTASTGNANYEVLFSETADNTTRTEGTRKDTKLKFNPYVGMLFSDYLGSSANITARITSLNFSAIAGPGTGRAAERLDLATSSVTTGAPYTGTAGYVHTYYWDGGAAMTQIYIPNGDHTANGTNGPQSIMMRGWQNDMWQNWEYIPYMKAAPTDGQVVIADGTAGGLKTSGYTIAKSVPSNAVFTDTWKANSKTSEGYVTASNGQTRKYWRSNANQNPGWDAVYESDLAWGGANYAGSFGCLDAAMIGHLGANRLFGAKAAGITVEYSRDAGSTWTDYGLTDAQKTAHFTQGYGLLIGKADSTNKATANGNKYQLRITLDTQKVPVYTVLNKIVMNISTNGSASCTVTIQRAHKDTPTTYADIVTDQTISGWSGWNVINISGTQTNNYYRNLRFIFKANGGDTNYVGLNVINIKAFGGMGWTVPSTMAQWNHLYDVNELLDAYFPRAIRTAGSLIVNPSDVVGNYDEGIRINKGKGNWSTLTMGANADSITGTQAGAWSLGVNNNSYPRKLMIGQNGCSASGTYFGTDADATVTPYLNLGSSGAITNGDTKAVTGGVVYTAIQNALAVFGIAENTSF